MKAVELEPWHVDGVPDAIGRPDERSDARAKVRGRARYASDVPLPGQLWAVLARSPHPHARIRSIDTTKALDVPEVVAVLGREDVEDVTWYEEQVPFLSPVARYVGDEIAIVVAQTAAGARDGAAALEVDYELLEHVTEPAAALSDAVAIHPGGNLVDDPEIDGRGDVERALNDASIVVDMEFRTNAAVHNALEPHGALADWRDGTVTVRASTQGVNDVRTILADRLGIDHNRVRVIAENIGGGFGAKQVPWKPTMAAVLASRQLGAPVLCMNDRRAENLAAGKRNPTIQRVRLGADREGRLVAIEADLVADIGAYSVAGEASDIAGTYLHLYRCDNVRTTTRRAYTNTGPAVAFRAPGYVEGTFALESAMDELARRLELDPIELRRRNYTEHDQQQDLPWSSPDALRISYERVEKASRWPRGGQASGAGGVSGVRVGRGFAAHEWVAATAMPPGHAWAELNADGSVHVATSTQDIGTGTRTMLQQVAAAEFGVDPERVRVTMGDTASGPPSPTSAGSTTTPTMAPAVRAVVAELRSAVVVAAAEHLGVSQDSLSFDGSTISSVRPDVQDLALADLLEEIAPIGIHARGHVVETPDDVSVRTFGSAVADVEVDTTTGEVRVTRIVVAPDCGRILNRRLVDSQVIGGVTQGIGFALTEEQLVDRTRGIVVNGNLEDYLVPTLGDTCEIVHAAVEVPDLAANALGVKGIGELPLIPVPAAIANAVTDALGIRFHELPLTRRRVLDALAGARHEESSR